MMSPGSRRRIFASVRLTSSASDERTGSPITVRSSETSALSAIFLESGTHDPGLLDEPQPGPQIVLGRVQIHRRRRRAGMAEQLLCEHEVPGLAPDLVGGGVAELVHLDRAGQPGVLEALLEPAVNRRMVEWAFPVFLRVQQVFGGGV